MNALRLTLSLGAGLAVLAACAGSQPPIGALGAMPRSPAFSHRLLPSSAYRVLSYRVIHRFVGGSGGTNPSSDLIYVNGLLYGTAAQGGLAQNTGNGFGLVYSITTSGKIKILHDFAGGSDGENPEAGFVDVGGRLYGTTYRGGRSGGGTVYRITTAGVETVLHAFSSGTDEPSNPVGDLIALDGTLYGATYLGGGGTCLMSYGSNYGCGTIYSITTTGKEKTLGRFSGKRDGKWPTAGLTAVDGLLYGTTSQGGTARQGTMFRISTSGVKKKLYNFGAGTDGRIPNATLLDVNGTLYGTTAGGGDSKAGTVFSISTDGAETVLHSFANGADGAYPAAKLIDVRGKLYGTTELGGS
ncbi:MAG TPA: choice-of-anchor tandem repeat GloVer-containing protein, partial [Candidatus Baltobacteraceae bacterium]|nr:choice-of-anchor tandem repeat GloVer-containing protein [Candidatus Baltobacteraceae bacterium]